MMKPMRYSVIVLAAIAILLPSLLAASAGPDDQPAAPAKSGLSLADARAAINATYIRWGKARVERDKATLDSILSSDFFVSLYGQKISREKFLSDISEERPGVRLTRFDTDILTVQASDDGWKVVIAEKLEIEFTARTGETKKMCSHWVTRDGWRREGDKWVATFSEAIGHQNWDPGTTPPIKGW